MAFLTLFRRDFGFCLAIIVSERYQPQGVNSGAIGVFRGFSRFLIGSFSRISSISSSSSFGISILHLLDLRLIFLPILPDFLDFFVLIFQILDLFISDFQILDFGLLEGFTVISPIFRLLCNFKAIFGQWQRSTKNFRLEIFTEEIWY